MSSRGFVTLLMNLKVNIESIQQKFIRPFLKTKTDGWTCVYYVGMYVKLKIVITLL